MTMHDLTRRFPFTVRPGHRETLDSYTRRVLAANAANDTLRRELLKSAGPDADWQSILSAKTGRDLTRLSTPTAHTAHPDIASCSVCASAASDRWACLLCSRGERIQQHPHLDDFVCERHHRWTAPGTTPEQQRRVTAAQVDAHHRLRTLRRQGRADIHLTVDLLDALTGDLDLPANEVFHHAVSILGWVTRKPVLRRLFDPAPRYAVTFAWMREELAGLVGASTPQAARTVWLHLWPAHVALQSAFRGYRGYRAGHPHDFTLPADITDWYPHPDRLQATREYLDCTGDDNLSALAQRMRDTPAPTPLRPTTRAAQCRKGHVYTEVVTMGAYDPLFATPCPTCLGRHVQPGKNDLATLQPELAATFHPTLNGDLTPAGITAHSSKPVWWLCEKEHPFRATPSNRTLNDSGCAVCLNRVVLRGVNDLATTHPRIARELHPSSGSEKPATEITASDTKRRRWLCPCGYEYKASARQRVTGHSCPECKKNRVRKSGRSLVDTHPHLAAEFLPELNEGRHPAEYTRGSKQKVIWWCSKGQHPFPMRIETRTRGRGCPYCAGRRLLEGFNDFATTHPDIASEWHPYLNWREPTEVMAGTNDLFHWKCPDGHEMRRSIPNRIASGGCTSCPREQRAAHRNHTLTNTETK